MKLLWGGRLARPKNTTQEAQQLTQLWGGRLARPKNTAQDAQQLTQTLPLGEGD